MTIEIIQLHLVVVSEAYKSSQAAKRLCMPNVLAKLEFDIQDINGAS